MSYISSKGITYTYTRNVINNLPIFVKLQTKSNITVTFKMSVDPLRRLSDNFVLFVGGEEGMVGSKHMVTIEMIVTFSFLIIFFSHTKKIQQTPQSCPFLCYKR
jgi:hypothetical protein